MKINTLNEFQYLDFELKDIYLREVNILLKSKSHPLLKEFKSLLLKNRSLIETFNPLNLFLMSSFSKHLHLAKLTQKINENFKNTLSSSQDELFEYWTSSEHSKYFLKKISSSSSFKEACLNTLEKSTQQLTSFFILYYIDTENRSALRNYEPITEIGDKKRGKIKSIGLSLYNKSKKFNYILIDNDPDHLKKHIKRIDLALNRISVISPISLKRFEHFTRFIIPINDPGIVSFSSQNLPQYSTLNLFSRDNVDLMDDLLHENGHHHLNSYLNIGTLLLEDNDLIYYSPWRKALRPIRGIYHAYFTFYWALDLFYNACKAIDNEQTGLNFKRSEIEKIKYRFCEEYLMLNYCWPDLEHGYAFGKITEDGFKLILEINKKIKAKKLYFLKISKTLNKTNISKIKGLEKKLQETRNNYLLTY